MRVADNVQTKMILRSLNLATERMQRYQQEVASGYRIQRPSDDPIGTQRAAGLRTGLAQTEQYLSTAKTAQAWLKSEDVALGNLTDALRQIRSYGLQGNTAQSEQSRAVLVQQITLAADTVVKALNSSDGTRSLFSGHKTTMSPFTGTAPGSVTYGGDDGVRRVEVGDGIVIALNHAGTEVANLGSAADPSLPELFTTIQQIMTAVSTGDAAAMASALQDLDGHMTRVNGLRAETGVKLNQTEVAVAHMQQAKVTLSDLLSDVEGADITESIVQLKTQENLYQAASYITGQIGSHSLLNWLR